MTDELDHETFDLIDAVAGRTYPEHTVYVSMDEKTAFDLYEVDSKIRLLTNKGTLRTSADDAELTRLSDEVRPGLIEKLRGTTYTFNLRGVSRDIRQEIYEVADEKYPPNEGTPEERAKVKKERSEYIENRTWLVHIESITNPRGQTNASLDEDTIQIFREQAPVMAVNEVASGIQELATGAKAGFETFAQDADFLSERSPEA